VCKEKQNMVARAINFLREDDGMEMVEWSIVGVVFALAAAATWTALAGQIGTALNNLGTCVDGSGTC
jgi:Flp pilus assembly pilin Flp